jgi:hypothetical protein
MEGVVVLEARLSRRRPRPEDEDVDEPPRARIRLSEPDGFSSEDGLSDHSLPEHHHTERAAMPRLRTPPPSDPNNGNAEPVVEDRNDARHASPPPDEEPSDAVTERSLSDVESVETPRPDAPAPRIRITPAYGDSSWAGTSNEQGQDASL